MKQWARLDDDGYIQCIVESEWPQQDCVELAQPLPQQPTPCHRFDYANQQWIDPRTPEQIASDLQADITKATQSRLDAFARTRNYDGILSAATYATSTVPKFAIEGQYCVEARDATWAALYAILAEVQAGTRPMPSGYADIEPLLPTLTWPN